ncbi:MAG TPA: DUF692 domain-containing protein [Burkholderiaceae bacterium]
MEGSRNQLTGTIPAQAGIGLRFAHHRAVVETRPRVAWFEVHSENYMGGGPTPAILEQVRCHYPISLHGVGLSLGSADGLSADHLARIRALIDRFEPGLVSEHLAWSSVDGVYLADLLPLPMTEEALQVVCRNIEHAQDALGRSLLVENPSSYLRYRHSTIPEWEFLAELARRTGCGLLCDVNNIVVSCSNHQWSASAYLAALPTQAVGEIHLAGHAVRELEGGRVVRIDDHGSRVAPPVWDLFAQAVARFGRVPTLIEWDTRLPALEVLLQEAHGAQQVLDRDQDGRRVAVAA